MSREGRLFRIREPSGALVFLIMALLLVTGFPVIGTDQIRSDPEVRDEESTTESDTWMRTYFGRNNDVGIGVHQTSDGGYLIAGSTNSFGMMDTDIWLIKTDSHGNMLWNKLIGGAGYDECYKFIRTTDGNFIILGRTDSFNDEKYGDYRQGSKDVWLIKIDEDGNELWDHTYGGPGDDGCYSIEQTLDDGFILTGTTNSFGQEGKLNEIGGSMNIWLIKLRADGIEEWNRTFGDNNDDDFGTNVRQSPDNGYVLTCLVISAENDDDNFMMIKTDDLGYEEWNKSFGNIGIDFNLGVFPCDNGSFIKLNSVYSSSSKLSKYLITGISENGTITSEKYYDFPGKRVFRSIVRHDEENITIFGEVDGQYFLQKMNLNGSFEWVKYITPSGNLNGYDVTSDRGYIFTGGINEGYPGHEVLLMKTDSNGTFEMPVSKNSPPVFKHLSPESMSTHSGIINVSGNVNDADGTVESVELRIDNGHWRLLQETTSWSYEWDSISVPNGEHTIYIRAYDGMNYTHRFIQVYTENLKPGGMNDDINISWTSIGTNFRHAVDILCPTSDGGYIFGGNSHRGSEYEANHKFYLTKTNVIGIVEWEFSYLFDKPIDPLKIIQTLDDGYAVLSSRLIDDCMNSYLDSNCQYISLTKFDIEGTEEWTVDYKGNASFQPATFEQTDDGGYIILGNDWNSDWGSVRIKILKTNDIGLPEWETRLNNTVAWGTDILEASNGDIVILGGTPDITLIRLDPQGNDIWIKRFDCDFVVSIQETQEGYIYIMGNNEIRRMGYTRDFNIKIFKIDVDGKEIWNKSYGGPYDDSGHSMLRTTDDGLIVAGSYCRFYNTYGGPLWVFTIDGDGEIEWEIKIGSNGYNHADNIFKMDEDSYVISCDLNDFEDITGGYGLLGINHNVTVTGHYPIYLIDHDDEPDTTPIVEYQLYAAVIGIVTLITIILIIWIVIRHSRIKRK